MLKRSETDFDYFSRRALEESRAALHGACGRASSAHRHMAAAYAVKLRDEQMTPEELRELLRSLAAAEEDARLAEEEARFYEDQETEADADD